MPDIVILRVPLLLHLTLSRFLLPSLFALIDHVSILHPYFFVLLKLSVLHSLYLIA